MAPEDAFTHRERFTQLYPLRDSSICAETQVNAERQLIQVADDWWASHRKKALLYS
jgi:hypothetical protein